MTVYIASGDWSDIYTIYNNQIYNNEGLPELLEVDLPQNIVENYKAKMFAFVAAREAIQDALEGQYGV